MQKRELSKLQIRSEVLLILQQYEHDTNLKPSKQKHDLETLESISEQVFVVEILLKEFLKASDYKRSIISFFLSNLVNLQDIEDILWDYLKNPKISDRIKEDMLTILRNLGAKINTDELLNYLEDPDELIDKETRNLLEIAKLNPEAQIDFLDFLFALQSGEQIQLIASLKDSYPGDDLANIIAPAFKASSDKDVLKALIETIGITKSYLAIEPLLYIIENSKDEELKRLAKKNLNVLKISGLNIEDKNKINLRENEICKTYKLYEAYASLPDGSGSQGIILGRIKDGKIYMFAVVINEQRGIIDCFGFSEITKVEFHKIIKRFTQEVRVIKVSPEYCKLQLEKAEKMNFENKSIIPYEYLCWKTFISDINKEDANIEDLFTFNKVDLSPEHYEKLYKSGDFDTWIFEYEDDPEIDKLINFVFNEFDEKNNLFINELNEKIEIAIKNIADKKWQKTLAERLMNCTYLYELDNDDKLRDIAGSIARQIKDSNLSDFMELKFVKDFVRRSILQYAGDCLEQEEETAAKKSPFSKTVAEKTKPILSYNKAILFIDYFEGYWC